MFVSIDGPDGTGKTTLAKMLVEKLNEKRLDAVFTAEPTHSAIGMKIREIIKTNCDSKILLEMFKKDRVEHIENFVCPALSEGKIVVCDRYILSTVCYQETPEHPIEKLVKDSSELLWPDIYFVLYFDEKDIGLVCERIKSRGADHDVYDTMEWVKKVNGNFLKMSKYYKNLTYINTNQSLENILAQMMNVIENKIKNE